MNVFLNVFTGFFISLPAKLVYAVLIPGDSGESGMQGAGFPQILVFLGSLFFILILIVMLPLAEKYIHRKFFINLLVWIPAIFSLGLVFVGFLILLTGSAKL